MDRLCRADYQPGKKESEANFLQRNSDFHLSIAAATGSDRLVSVLKQTLMELERMFHFRVSLRGRGSEMHTEHKSNIDALAEAMRKPLNGSPLTRSDPPALLSSASLLDMKIGIPHESQLT